MKTPEEQFAETLRKHLDLAAGEVRSGVAYRLQQARAAALARAAEVRQTAGAGELAMAGHRGAGDRGGRPRYLQPRMWLALALLVAGMIGFQQWRAWEELQELEDLDAQILSSDLPIDAYLDRGFQLWLKTSKPDE